MIPGSANPLLLKSAAAAGYQIERSLRFNSSDSAYLSRTPASAGNRKTWTWAGWVKRSSIGSGNQTFFRAGSGTWFKAGFQDEAISVSVLAGSAEGPITSAVFRDLSAWYHIVIAFDTTQATPADRTKLYVNRQQIAFTSNLNWPALNTDYQVNNTVAHLISDETTPERFNGYLADIYFIDGQALDPTSFTEVSATTGQLIPKAYTGSFGTNGFWLKFSDNSAATAAALGNDYSGNNNDWTPNNLSVTAGAGNDSLVDTPTSYGTDTGAGGEVRGNYCTLNPLNTHTSITLSNGNLDYSHSSSGGITVGTIGVSSGKYYWEHVSGTAYALIGLYQSGARDMGFVGTSGVSLGFTSGGFATASGGPTVANNISFTTSDVIGFALNMDTGTLTIYKNGTATSLVFSGLTGTWSPAEGANSTSSGVFNFGQRAFAYTAPSGFKALVDTNLTAPVVAKPNTVMDVKLYTGNGSTQTISGLGFSPDLVWIKTRSAAANNRLLDAIRGATKELYSNLTNAEGTDANGLTAFNSDGFSLGNSSGYNDNAVTHVAWAWDAGSSTVTNTQGSITSQVRANASAGFSIVTYTGTGSSASVGHGLGVAPAFYVTKRRDSSSFGNWTVYHSGVGTQTLELNSTGAAFSDSTRWPSAATSTVFNIGSNGNVNTNGGTYVAYVFSPVAGYSSFGSYTGNGSADGPFVYTGMRPRWLLIKRYDGAGNWVLIDTARNAYNTTTQQLFPNSSDAEYSNSAEALDILSNGFKPRSATSGHHNFSGYQYLYIALAESPFQYARAR